jgi:hypothetical protein
VLDLRTGTVQLLAGVTLAADTGSRLAFSRDSGWLLIALNEGDRARLLVWRPGWPGPKESPAELPGRILYWTPILDVTRHR